MLNNIQEKEIIKKKIRRRLDFVRGTLYPTYRTCGYEHCRCRKGEKHGPFYLLTVSIKGKTISRHIPRDRVGKIREMIENYRQIKDLIEELSQVNLKIILDKKAGEEK